MRYNVLAVLAISSIISVSHGATINITTNTTWSGQTSPTIAPGDTVNVYNSAVLTIDIGNAQCASLNLGVAGLGKAGLLFQSGSSLTVTSSLVIGADASNQGAIDMLLGGTLVLPSTVTENSTLFFKAGNGTIRATKSVTLPASSMFSTYNILTIDSNATMKLGRDVTVTTVNLGEKLQTSGTLDLNGHNCYLNSIAISGGQSNTITNTGATANLTVDVPYGTLTYNGAITNSVTLVKVGPGTLNVSGTSKTYTGGTRIELGTLQLGASNVLPTNIGVTLGNGTNSGILDLNGFNQTVPSITNNGTGTSNTVLNTSGNSTLTISGAGNTFAGSISGSVAVNINVTGTMTFSGINDYSGATNIQKGTLLMGSVSSLSSNTVVTVGSSTNTCTLDLGGNSESVAGIASAGTGTNTIKSTGGTPSLTVGTGQTANSNFGGQIIGANLTLAADSNHTLTLTGSGNTFGAMTISNNATVRAGSSTAIPAGIPVTMSNGTLDINGFDVSIGTLSSAGGTINNLIRDNTSPQAQAAKSLITTSNSNSTFSGQVAAVLVKAGTGALTIDQPATLSVLKIQGGSVLCGTNGIFSSGGGNATSVILGNGAAAGTLNLGTTTQTVGMIGTSGSAGASNTITSTGAATLNIQNTQLNSPFSYNGSFGAQVGVTTLNASTSPLSFNGSASSTAFTVNGPGSAPLYGTGSVGTLNVVNGIVRPGDASVGTLTAANANFSSSGQLKVRIQSAALFDTLAVTNTLTLGGSSSLEVDMAGYTAAEGPKTFTIATDSSRPVLNSAFSTFTVINNSSGFAVELDYSDNTKIKVVVGAVPVIQTASLPTGNVGGNYSFSVLASNSPSNFTMTGLPPGLNYNNSGSINGTPTVAGTFPVTISASNQGGTGPQVVLSLTVNPGPFTKLQLLMPGETAAPGTPSGKITSAINPHVGVPFSITVNAVDDQWNVVSSVNDLVTFTSTDDTAVLPGNTALVNGTVTITNGVTLTAAAPRPAPLAATTITAIDFSDTNKGSYTTNSLTVIAGAFAKLQLLLPGETEVPGSATGKKNSPMPQQATKSFSVKVNAVDAYFNVINSVSDTVALTSSDTLAALPPNAALFNGTANFNVTLNLGPTQTLTVSDVSDPANSSDTSPNITINPGDPTRIQVLLPGESNAPGNSPGKTGTPIGQTSGTPFQVTVNLVDAYFTVVKTNHAVHFTSSDAGATLPNDLQLINGTVTQNVTLVTGPTQTISVSDNDNLTVFAGTSAPVSLATVTSNLTGITPDAGIQNGASFTLTVNGSNFLNTSVVRWNGSDRPTTFVSDTQLTATIDTTDLSNAGQASVTVYTPPPGTGLTTAATFYVYSGTTTGVWVVSDTGNTGQGTLRLAMSSCRNGDLITFDPLVFDLTNSDAATLINVTSALPLLDKGNITIDASDRRVTINGSGATSASGLVITSSGNTVRGLNIIGFTQSGVVIKNGATNNIIGGSRTTGTGVNGQGLRISGNGAFGIQISGSGTTGNTVKGCWIGLDAAGTASQPNLAGILLDAGAQGNTIGGTGSGEANVISGNAFEGVTISGTGTDNNTIIANQLGVSAVDTVASRSVGSRTSDVIQGRSAMGNGSAGVFLSKGTTGSQVGGTTTAEGNAVANNGGNGVEVRSVTSKKNSSRGNSITKNSRGGIALFDNSNGGIPSPHITGVRLVKAASRDILQGRSTIHVSGTIPADSNNTVRDGTVEIFTDSGDQGGTFATRTTATNGVWEADIDVGDSENITATLTDDQGNTSSFETFVGPTVTSPTAASGIVGVAFTYQIAGSNTPTSFGVDVLPAGLTLDTATGVISGTPTAEGTSVVTITATNAGGDGTATLTITINPATYPAITSALTASASQNTPFSYTITASGVQPITFNAVGLPPGLLLANDTISGSPALSGSVDVTLIASNSIGTDSKVLRITIAPPAGTVNNPPQLLSAPTASTLSAVPGQVITFSAAASDPDGNLISYTWDFGDGTTGTGPTPAHMYAAASTYTVQLTVSDGIDNVKGTLTIVIGAGGTAASLDSDGDGYPDGIETALGSNAADATSTPFGTGPITPEPLLISKVSMKLSFTKQNADGIGISGVLLIPKGISMDNRQLVLEVGGVVRTFNFNGTGSVKTATESIKLGVKTSNGVTVRQGGKFTIALKGTFSDTLAAYDFLKDEPVLAAPTTLPITIVFNNTVYQNLKTVTYTATPGKGGSAK